MNVFYMDLFSIALFAFSIVLLAVYCFACLSLGTWLIGLAGGKGEEFRRTHSPAARVFSAFLFGSGVLANVWLLLGLLPGGWFRGPVVGGVAAVCLLAGWRKAWRAAVELHRQFHQACRRLIIDAPWPWKVIGLASLVLVVIYFLTSALPPKGDAAAFYMSLPKIIAHVHQLVLMPGGYESFMQFGQHGEMHFAALISLGSGQAATMFVFAMAVASAGMLLEIGRLAGLGSRGRWIVMVMVFTSTAFVCVIPGGKVDLFGTAMALGALYWVAALGRERASLCLMLAGVLTGFGVVAKISLLVPVVPMVGVLALWRMSGVGRRHVVASLGVCCVALVVWAGIACVPHLIKNGVLYGDPLVPFSLLLSGKECPLLNQQLLSDAFVERLRYMYPVAPFLGQFPGMFGSISALVLAFFPLALFLPRPRRFSRSLLVQLTAVAVLGVVCWAVLQTANFSLRYFLPPLMLLMLLPARAAEVVSRSAVGRRVLAVGVIICLCMGLAERFNRTKGHPGKAVKYVLGISTAAEVAGGEARSAEAINAHGAQGRRVFLATCYSYFLQPGLLATASGQEDYDAIKSLPAGPERWEEFYRRGFRYIMAGPSRATIAKDAKSGDFYGLDLSQLPRRLTVTPIYLERDKAGEIRYAAFVIQEN